MFKGEEAARTKLCECDTLRTLREEGDAERATEGSWGFVLRVIRIQGLNGVVTGAPPWLWGGKWVMQGAVITLLGFSSGCVSAGVQLEEVGLSLRGIPSGR